MPLNFPQLRSDENLLVTTLFSKHQAAEYWPLLSSSEQHRAQQKINQTLRDQAILSYGLRRSIIATLLNADAKQLIFDQIANQKPILRNHPLHFNVSHSDDHWVILLNRASPIGVDIEFMERKTNCLQLAKRFFSPIEVTLIAADATQNQLFWQLWTAKEALLKATGQGLLNGLDRVHLFMNTQGKWQAYAEEFNPWQLETQIMSPNAMLTAAIPKQQNIIHLFF